MIGKVPELLSQKYPSLTASQKKLADFILHYPHEAALMTSAQLAKTMKVSEATVVRFAQEIGFTGYPDLKESLQQQLLREIRSSERVATMVYHEKDSKGTLEEIVSQTTHFTQHLMDNVSEDALDSVVQCLVSKKKIYLFGEGAPGAMIHHANFWFSRLGFQVNAITQTGRRFFDQIFQATADDTVILFAFRRPTVEAIALLEVFKENGGPSILVTDLVNSRMHPLATSVLLVQRGPMDAFRPLGPLAALVDAIILGLMRHKGNRAVEQLRRLDDLRQRYGHLFEDR